MRTFSRRSIFVVAGALLPATAYGMEQIPAAPDKQNPLPAAADPDLWHFFSAKTPYEFWLTCIILLAGLAFAWLAVSFLRQIEKHDLENATRAMTILFVILATMVLITAGYNNEQIAPAFGLFGTIVGYILGQSEKPKLPSVADGANNEGQLPDARDDAPSPASPPSPQPIPRPAASGSEGKAQRNDKPQRGKSKNGES